ncbi:MAG: TIGR02099 family protein [Thiogranum sp.]|nr:TIGR02099 family protein [Thiogranum sp.]
MWFARLSRLLWWFAAVVVVTLAVALSAARILLPGMSEYKAQIETAAGKLVRHPVRIGTLDAAWRGLSPVLRLKHVIIRDPQLADGVLVAEEVQVGLDLLKSLAQRRWFTSGIRIIGVTAGVRTDLANWHGDAGGIGPLLWLLQQKSIALENVSFEWTDPALRSQPLRVHAPALRLVNDGRRHQLLLQFRFPDTPGDKVTLAADLSGPLNNLNAWQGRVYVRAADLDLAAVAGWLDSQGIATQGRVDLELWAGIRDRKLDWGNGSLRIQSPALSDTTGQAPPFSADELGGAFHWQLARSGWQLELLDLELRRDNRLVWPASTVRVAVETGETPRARGTASHLVLDELTSVLPLVPWIDADALIMLERLQPSGELRDAEFSLGFPGSQVPRAALRARFDDLRLGAGEETPGVRGLSGRIEGNLQSGWLRLDCAQSALVIPELFGAPLQLSSINGLVHWQRYAKSFRVESDRLAVTSGDIAVDARMQLDWPYASSSPWLDLQVAAAELPLSRVRDFLPDQVMSPKATQWLQQAFAAGTARDARLLLQGRLDQLPFDDGEGRLEARFTFADAVLNYHPEWGRLEELQGSARFLGRSMHISADRARILESPVQHAVATIDDFKRPLLQVEGAVGGSLSGMLRYMTTTPLAGRAGDLVQQIVAQGDAQLQLSLGIPLKRELGKVRVNGSVALDGNRLGRKSGKLAVSDIKGKVHFTRDGITADKARAMFLGEPIAVSVHQGGAGADSKTIVDIEGRLNLMQLLGGYQPAATRFADGLADWHALIHVPNQYQAGEPIYEVQLQSDLVGLAIDLPEPLHKEKEEARSLTVNWSRDQAAGHQVMVSYADLLDARLLPTATFDAIQRADIRFGGGLARLPERDEIHIGGNLQRLDPAQWIALFGKDTANAEAVPRASKPAPVAFDLEIGELSLPGSRVERIELSSASQDPWKLRVQGEGAAGSVRWSPAAQAAPAKLQVDLQHLFLQPLTRAAPTGDRDNRLARPQALPALDISIGDLRWGERELGNIGVQAAHAGQGMVFESLSMTSRAVVLAGRGHWSNDGGVQRSRFSADISGGKLEELHKLLGGTSSVRGGELTGNLTLNWPGGPAAFSLETLEGDLRLKARDGRLVHVDEGAGKLLNLFSLNSLQRRLTLDFSDVTKEGFSFSEMSGHFVVMDGDAYTSDFTINGSSAIIEITGRTGLIARDYDQMVSVTPQVSSSLPIAGAIAGGPAVGAAVFLAEKLVGKEFNRMTRVEYHVSGSWDNPVYERLGRNRDAENAPAAEKR